MAVAFREGSSSYRKGIVIVITAWVSILLLVIYWIGKIAGLIS